MFPPMRIGKPPQPKKKMPRIIPRVGQRMPMPQPVIAQPQGQTVGAYSPPDDEMNEPPGPEEPEMPPPRLGRLKNIRAMLTSRKNIRRK